MKKVHVVAVLLALLALVLAGCASTDLPSKAASPHFWDSYDVIDHLQFSGVPAGATELLDSNDLPALPHSPVEARQFTIVILSRCAPCRGRVYSFASGGQAEAAHTFLLDSAVNGTSEYGWVYRRDNVVILLGKDVPQSGRIATRSRYGNWGISYSFQVCREWRAG